MAKKKKKQKKKLQNIAKYIKSHFCYTLQLVISNSNSNKLGFTDVVFNQ